MSENTAVVALEAAKAWAAGPIRPHIPATAFTYLARPTFRTCMLGVGAGANDTKAADGRADVGAHSRLLCRNYSADGCEGAEPGPELNYTSNASPVPIGCDTEDWTPKLWFTLFINTMPTSTPSYLPQVFCH